MCERAPVLVHRVSEQPVWRGLEQGGGPGDVQQGRQPLQDGQAVGPGWQHLLHHRQEGLWSGHLASLKGQCHEIFCHFFIS